MSKIPDETPAKARRNARFIKPEYIVAIGVISLSCIFAVIFRQYPRIYFIASIAPVVVLCLGFAGWQLWKWIQTPRIGWMDDLIDSVGRENLIVWRQFGRKTTDEDIEFARNVGSTFATQNKKLHQTKGQIGFSSIETMDDAVGVRLIGVNADNMLRLIRPFFQQHFPRGSFVTRSRLWRDDEDENAPKFYWKHPQPLFEDDEITPPWWLSVYMRKRDDES